MENMKRGRPVKSPIRQNIIELLFFMKKGYGYGIYRNYKTLFPAVTMRSIYYHLKKGQETGEFKIHKIERERGDYSWGVEAEKIWYELGDAAFLMGNEKVKEMFEKR